MPPAGHDSIGRSMPTIINSGPGASVTASPDTLSTYVSAASMRVHPHAA